MVFISSIIAQSTLDELHIFTQVKILCIFALHLIGQKPVN